MVRLNHASRPTVRPSVKAPESLFRPGHNCSATGRAERAAVLVDGADYFDAFVRATDRAQRSILILGWDFDSRTVLRHDAQGHPELVVGEWLNTLAQRNRHLHIRILDWDYPMIFGKDREFPPIYGFRWKPHRRVDFRYDDTHPLAGSHHQKIVVVDDCFAFVGGLDLTSKRWDTPRHAPDDERRRFLDAPYPPMHDVVAAVDGELAQAVARLARERWLAATGETLHVVHAHGDPWPAGLEPQLRGVTGCVASTAPPVVSAPAVREIEQLYLDMIAAARDYIYIENQYFTSRTIADALATRLRQPDGPEIVLVTRLLSHGWLEEVTMHVLRTRLVNELREADHHGRFRAYYPHVDGLAEGTCIDLHSKVMVVDDAWLRVGSSNLSNRSMGLDTECDVTFEAREDPALREAIRAFRDTLLAEHAGVPVEELQRELERAGTMAKAVAALPRNGRRLEELETPEAPETQLELAAIGDLAKPLAIESMVMPFTPPPASPRPPGWRALALLCLVAILLALAWSYTPLSELVSREKVVEWGQAFAQLSWAPLVLVLAYTPAAFTMFPRWLLTMVAVIAFGPWMGFAYGLCGMVIAGLSSYAPGRLVHRDTVRRLAGPRLARVMALMYRRGALAVAVMRLLPVAPFVVVNFVMGAMRIRVRDFVLGSVVGVMPGMLAATVLSEQLSRALADPATINGWLVGIAAFCLGALAWFGQRWLRRMDVQDSRVG